MQRLAAVVGGGWTSQARADLVRLVGAAPDARTGSSIASFDEGSVCAWPTGRSAGRGPVRNDGVTVALNGFLTRTDGLRQRFGSCIGDEELIASAFALWGPEFAAHLDGEFALILWDAAQRRLLAVSDRFGTRPLYYASDKQTTYVSTEPEALLARIGRRETTSRVVARVLAGKALEPDESPYDGVRRLGPGQVLVASALGLRTRTYWTLSPPDQLRATGKGGSGEALLFHLRRSVADRLENAGRPAFNLSGGLDSTTICYLGAEASAGRQIDTFSLLFPSARSGDERAHIEAALSRLDAAPHFVPADDFAPLADPVATLARAGGPVVSPNAAALRSLYQAVADAGGSVLLTGEGGDEINAFGTGLFLDYAEAGRWTRLWRELRARDRVLGEAESGALLAKFILYALRRRLRPLRPRRGGQDTVEAFHPEGATGVLRPEVARAFGIGEPPPYTRKRIPGMAVSDGQHFLDVSAPGQSHLLTMVHRDAGDCGIEARHPFWDREVVETSLALEPQEKYSEGMDRLALRTAMRGILPDVIRLRSDKFDFTDVIVAALVKYNSAEVDARLRTDGPLNGFIRTDEVVAAWERLRNGRRRTHDFWWVWRTLWVSFWLEGVDLKDLPGGA